MDQHTEVQGGKMTFHREVAEERSNPGESVFDAIIFLVLQLLKHKSGVRLR